MKKIIQIGCFILISIFRIDGQSDMFLQNYQELSAKNPQDLTFNLSLASDKNQFRQGEIIPLKLEFSSSSANKYNFDSATYDRSGRLNIDGFVIDKPEQTADPLFDYYHKGFSIFMMGGLRSFGELKVKPYTVNYELNEWIRFDNVGKYRLYVGSGRIWKGEVYGEKSESVSPVSNIIEFEVIPADELWQKKTLNETVALLNSPLNEKEHRAACRVLRFLGTEDAAAEIVKRFNGADRMCDFEFYMGLQGSPQRKFIIGEMEKALDKPEFPVSRDFLQNLSFLSYFYKNTELEPNFSDEKGSVDMKKWQQYHNLQQNLKRIETQYYNQRLENAVKNKKGKALAVSIDTVFNFRDAKEKSEILNTLIAVFDDLPDERQENLLKYRWEQINTPKMLSVLQKIYALYEKTPQNDYQYDLRDIVLKRIYELSPEEGKSLILKELSRSPLRLSREALTILNDPELSELENIWLKNAANIYADYNEREKDLILLERYGTKKSLSPLRQTYEKRIGQIECAVQENLLSYFFKNDYDLGLKTLKKAMTERSVTKCYNSVFERIPSKYWSKDIEQIAVSYLSDENIGVVKSVVEVLGKNGSSDVKEKIWHSFEQFSRRMKSDDSSINKIFGDYNYPIQTIESSFINALTESPNWKLSETEISNLSQFCISKTCQVEVKNLQGRNEMQ